MGGSWKWKNSSSNIWLFLTLIYKIWSSYFKGGDQSQCALLDNWDMKCWGYNVVGYFSFL